jgi:hypothetical protein
MKKSIIILSLFITTFSFGQSIIAKTEDGRRVILNKDKTWEFIDKTVKEVTEKVSDADCKLPKNFKEPKGKNSFMYKRGEITLKDLKKHVSVDFDCTTDDIIVIKASEQKGNGAYTLCVKGQSVKYRRAGTVFFRQGTNPVGKY